MHPTRDIVEYKDEIKKTDQDVPKGIFYAAAHIYEGT